MESPMMSVTIKSKWMLGDQKCPKFGLEEKKLHKM